MERIADSAAQLEQMPRFADGSVNLQELFRSLAERIVNEVMAAEAEQLCGETGNSRNGFRERRLNTCVGTLTLRIPKLRSGSFFPDDVIERYQRTDRALVAAIAEMYATGTSTRKVAKVAEALGVARLSKDQVSAIAASLDADVAELLGRPLGGLDTPYMWLDATYVKCRREGRVASTAVVTAIGCDREGYRRVLGVSVVDTESEGSWTSFLRTVKERGVRGVRLVVSDAHPGLVNAVASTFQGAAWQRCAVHLMRDCMRECPSKSARRRVGRILSTVFRAKDPDLCRAMYHAAADMVAAVSARAAKILEEAECDALAYLDFPASHWKRLRTNNVQERCNREIKRRTRVVQVFPSVKSLERLAGAVMCEVDEAWSASRYFDERKMDELYDEHRLGRVAAESAAKDMAKVQEDARRMLEAAVELADRVEGK